MKKNTFNWLSEFLQLLESTVPVQYGSHHAIMYGDKQEPLLLYINRQIEGKGFHKFLMDDADFEMEPKELVKQIKRQMDDWDEVHSE